MAGKDDLELEEIEPGMYVVKGSYTGDYNFFSSFTLKEKLGQTDVVLDNED